MHSNLTNISKTLEFCFSAPAKFILSGEHSVVYGKDALVATIDLRTRAKCQIIFSQENFHKEKNLLLDVKLIQVKKNFGLTIENFQDIILGQKYDWDTIQDFFIKFQDNIRKAIPHATENNLTSDEEIHFFYILAHTFKYIFAMKNYIASNLLRFLEFLQGVTLKITIDSELPISKGIGSSASYSVAIAASLLKFWEIVLKEFSPENLLNVDFSNQEEFKNHVNCIAFDIEKIFHATPSGLDNSAITYGGILSYNRVEKKREKLTGNFLEHFEIILVDSGVEKNTKKTVQMIREMTEKDTISQATISIINAIGDITKSIESILNQKESVNSKTEAKQNFEQLIKMNHCLLKALNLTNSQIDQIIQICDTYKFIGKLTGGGNGGYCVCFISKDQPQEKINDFLKVLESNGFETLRLRFANSGLELEKFAQN